MKNMNWKIEESIHDDIALINRVLDSSDLTDLRVRMALYDGIRKETVFQSAFGCAFLESLIGDHLYDHPDAAKLIRRDLDALERMTVYMQSNDGVSVVERMKKYQFRCDWIRQFSSEYLNGYCLGSPVKEGYLAEISDMETIRKLVKIGNAKDSFQYDEVYAIMENQENKDMFHSWIGEFFREAVRTKTSAFQRRKLLLRRIIMSALLVCAAALIIILVRLL